MEEQDLKNLAAQLRKPSGEFATQIGNTMNEGNALMNLNTIDQLVLKPGMKVLELGMGNGAFVQKLFEKQADIEYLGVDYSPEMVAESKANNEELIHQGKVDFVQGDVSKLPVEDNSIDCFFTVNTLYFWDDPFVAFNDIKRVLKPGGKLIIAIRPNHEMKEYPMVKYGFELFDESTVKQLVTDNGFEHKETVLLKEPDQEVMGIKFKLSSLIVKAIKN